MDHGGDIHCTIHLSLPTDVTNEFPHGALSLGHSIWPYENAAISTTVSMDYRTSTLSWIIIYSNTLLGCLEPCSNGLLRTILQQLIPREDGQSGGPDEVSMFQKYLKAQWT